MAGLLGLVSTIILFIRASGTGPAPRLGPQSTTRPVDEVTLDDRAGISPDSQ
jgi:hypothetical protein